MNVCSDENILRNSDKNLNVFIQVFWLFKVICVNLSDEFQRFMYIFDAKMNCSVKKVKFIYL
jgi:hypothetical protein